MVKMIPINKENCYYCNKPVNNLAGNPSEWGIPLCHKDKPEVVKTHHIGCVSKRLAENEELKNCLKEAIDLMEDIINGKYKPDSFTTQPWKKTLIIKEKDK